MRDRHGVWWSFVFLTSVVGLLCAYAAWGWRGSATAALTIATFVAVIGGCACAEYGRSGGAKATRLTVTAGLVLTAAAGLLAVMDVFALCLILPLAATSPAARSLARRFLGGSGSALGSPDSREAGSRARARPEPAGHELVETTATDLRTLDDAALCLAWRRSFLRLSAAKSIADSLSVVKQRQSVLDELHRRSPQGLVAWFNAGGRASGNPLPFLAYHSDDDPWQGLTPPDAGGAHL
jgi:hypothetical protein